MANLIIKPSAGGDLVIKGSDDSPAITVGTTGQATFAEAATMSGNVTMSGTANNLGTATAGTLASGVTGGSGLDGGKSGTCHFIAHDSADSWNTLSGGSICHFHGERHDPDGVYDTSTSLFTAPEAGVYIFGCHIYTVNADTDNQFGFYINGSQPAYSYHSGAQAFYQQNAAASDDQLFASSVVYTLASGNTVGVYAISTSDQYEGHSWWWGCRLK